MVHWLLVAWACVAITAQDFAAGLMCYNCTSSNDKSCRLAPSSLTACPTMHGTGCGTIFNHDGTVRRGCSKSRLHPAACEMVDGVAEHCVCHSDQCSDKPEAPKIENPGSTFRCFVCNSSSSPQSCGKTMNNRWTTMSVSCPAFSGCFLTSWKDSSNSTHWKRECPYVANSFPTSYSPSGCYEIHGKEVCVCRTDDCNSDRDSVMTSRAKEAEPVNSSIAHANPCLSLSLAAITVYRLYYFRDRLLLS